MYYGKSIIIDDDSGQRKRYAVQATEDVLDAMTQYGVEDQEAFVESERTSKSNRTT